MEPGNDIFGRVSGYTGTALMGTCGVQSVMDGCIIGFKLGSDIIVLG